MTKQIFLFLLLAFTISSCCKKKEATPNLCAEPAIENSTCTTDSNQIKLAIIGKWSWTQSISSWTMQKTNPCTDTINRSYEFLSNGEVKYSENGSYKSTGNYHFESGSGFQISAHDASSNFWLSGWVSICNNYLIIDDSPVDGAKMTFVKTN
jgi:hypothetical protein